MVLIQTQDFDPSTNEVIDWLIYWNIPYHRINSEDEGVEVTGASIGKTGETDVTIKLRTGEIKLRDITGFWNRRGRFPVKLLKEKYAFLDGKFGDEVCMKMHNNMHDELESIRGYIIYKLATQVKRRIGNPDRTVLNKLFVLDEALKAGLRVPVTCVTGNKRELERFINEYKRVITKAILDNIYIHTEKEGFMYYTEEITPDRLRKISNTFFPSLFQAQVAKKFELRIFYLHGVFYPMAIFSQSDDQTQVDFRKYNYEKPNRTVAYELPQEISEKLLVLMTRLQLDTGSIDMIYTLDNEYVFLEVNPVGQFGMVSHPCNFYLEKKIAAHLASDSQINL